MKHQIAMPQPIMKLRTFAGFVSLNDFGIGDSREDDCQV